MKRDKSKMTSAQRWSSRRYIVSGAVLAVMLTSGVGIWATQSMIAGAVVAPGHLRVDSKLKDVTHFDGGIVKEILVRDGDHVEAGEVLIRLDPTSAAANLAIIDSQLDERMTLRARLLAEQFGHETIEPDEELRQRIVERPEAAVQLSGQEAIFAAGRTRAERQISQLREQLEQMRQQIAGHDAQLQSNALQLELVREGLADTGGLFDRGLAPKSQMIELRQQEANLIGDRGAITAQSAEAGARISEIGLRILEIQAERHQAAVLELREVEAAINELRQQRLALAPSLQRMEIRAPQAGVVLNMEVNTVGGVIIAGRPVLSIVPDGEELVVEVRIDATARDRVWVGQEARIKFPSFNQRITPEISGTVKTIAADALEDERTGARYFPADLHVEKEPLELVQSLNEVDLTPGMPAEVYITTAERSAGSYLLKPVMDSFHRAFRED